MIYKAINSVSYKRIKNFAHFQKTGGANSFLNWGGTELKLGGRRPPVPPRGAGPD